MNITTLNKSILVSQGLSSSDRVQQLCQLAKQLEESGDYERACELLSEFWPNHYEPPLLDGLDPRSQAELLVRVGALVGWTGSAGQEREAQETAKDLISRGIEIYQALGDSGRATSARSDLALCYWRQGAFDEARILFKDVVDHFGECDEKTKITALIRQAIVEKTAGRYTDALSMYRAVAPMVEKTESHALKGSFHIGLGTLLNNLALAERSEEHMDRALVEFAAASYHFEQAGHTRYCARVENNLGYLFFTLNRFEEAYSHLNRARRVCADVADVGTAAQVDDTRARALMTEGRLPEAERFAQAAVRALERGGEQSLLAEALTTHGTVLARMGKVARAKSALQRAIEVGQTSGDLEGSGRAHLSLIEELGQQISLDEMASHYNAASDLLKSAQDSATTARLIACGRRVVSALDPSRGQKTRAILSETEWEGFSFKKQVLEYEKEILARALRDTGGAVTKAARLLGFNHHQSLIALINARHKGLVGLRAPARVRRKSIINRGKNTGRKARAARKS